MNKIQCSYIKYKFIFNNNIKHSSYLYQKVFRSIYGYTQNVTKKDKKTYLYHRIGVLENIPYIRPGKNSVIIPLNTEHSLINFFNIGTTPTHHFREKGDWNINYSIEKIEINDIDIIRTIEKYIDSLVIISIDGNNKKLTDELNKIIEDTEYLYKYKKANKYNLLNKIKQIQEIDWFVKCKKSERITNFYNTIEKVKNIIYSNNYTTPINKGKEGELNYNKEEN